ncbi:hypothetical protein BH09MYX1_BH09MYX1_12710 [soil metagenome]
MKGESAKPDDIEPTEEELAASERENEAMRALLKRSLAVEPEKLPEKPMLAEVQRKIRQRSKGKFYGDGWSTTGTKVNYAFVAVVMLLIVGLAYFALGPVGLSAH